MQPIDSSTDCDVTGKCTGIIEQNEEFFKKVTVVVKYAIEETDKVNKSLKKGIEAVKSIAEDL